MSKRSLEYRLNTRLDAGIAIYLVAFSLVLGLFLVHGLMVDFDRALIAKAEGIVDIARQELAAAEGPDAEAPSFDGVRLGHFAIWLSDGTLIGDVDALDTLDIAIDAELSDTPRFGDLELPDGRDGRKVEIDFVPRQEGGHDLLPSQVTIGSGVRTATLVVAESREALDRQILRVVLVLAGACSLLLAGLALMVRTSLRRGLEPVVGLRRQVELLSTGHSVHRVGLANPPDELAPVLNGINELLQRRSGTPKSEETPADIARAS